MKIKAQDHDGKTALDLTNQWDRLAWGGQQILKLLEKEFSLIRDLCLNSTYVAFFRILTSILPQHSQLASCGLIKKMGTSVRIQRHA